MCGEFWRCNDLPPLQPTGITPGTPQPPAAGLVRYLHDEYGNLVTDDGINPVYLAADVEAMATDCLTAIEELIQAEIAGHGRPYIESTVVRKAKALLAQLKGTQP